MAEPSGRFDGIVRLARIWLVVVFACLGVALVNSVYHMVTMISAGHHWTTLAPSVLEILAEIGGTALAFIVAALVRISVVGESSLSSVTARMERVETLLEDQANSAKKLVDLACLSDQAKSFLFREREVEAFRETIHEHIMTQHSATAAALIESIEKKLGYAEEAARLRKELEDSNKATQEEKLDAAIRRIDDIADLHDWSRALRETQRLLRLFPGAAKVTALPERIEAARTKHKRDLLQVYGEAVRKNDVDRGIELLKELDRYLTPQEAAALEESARGVFRAKLHNLGVQFAIAVTDKQWARALATGEEIVRAFPNTRMAQEVRQKLDPMRAHAAAEATKA